MNIWKIEFFTLYQMNKWVEYWYIVMVMKKNTFHFLQINIIQNGNGNNKIQFLKASNSNVLAFIVYLPIRANLLS